MGAGADSLAGPCTPRADDVVGVTQAGATESPPIPWVGQPDPLLLPTFEFTLFGLAAATLGPAAATWLPPALEVTMLGLAPTAWLLPALGMAWLHATQAVARTTTPAVARITDTRCRARGAQASTAPWRIQSMTQPPLGLNRNCHELIFCRYRYGYQRSAQNTSQARAARDVPHAPHLFRAACCPYNATQKPGHPPAGLSAHIWPYASSPGWRTRYHSTIGNQGNGGTDEKSGSPPRG